MRHACIRPLAAAALVLAAACDSPSGGDPTAAADARTRKKSRPAPCGTSLLFVRHPPAYCAGGLIVTTAVSAAPR